MKEIVLVKQGGFVRVQVDGQVLETKLDEKVIRDLRKNKTAVAFQALNSMVSMVAKKLSGEEVKLDHSDISKIVSLLKTELNLV